jgi:predicted RNase H-like nuclease (RuvC/YqgF family)
MSVDKSYIDIALARLETHDKESAEMGRGALSALIARVQECEFCEKVFGLDKTVAELNARLQELEEDLKGEVYEARHIKDIQRIAELERENAELREKTNVQEMKRVHEWQKLCIEERDKKITELERENKELKLTISGKTFYYDECPYCISATDGVHIVRVDRCTHPERDKWQAQKAQEESK